MQALGESMGAVPRNPPNDVARRMIRDYLAWGLMVDNVPCGMGRGFAGVLHVKGLPVGTGEGVAPPQQSRRAW